MSQLTAEEFKSRIAAMIGEEGMSEYESTVREIDTVACALGEHDPGLAEVVRSVKPAMLAAVTYVRERYNADGSRK